MLFLIMSDISSLLLFIILIPLCHIVNENQVITVDPLTADERGIGKISEIGFDWKAVQYPKLRMTLGQNSVMSKFGRRGVEAL